MIPPRIDWLKMLHRILMIGALASALVSTYMVLVAMRSVLWGALPFLVWLVAWRVGVQIKKTEKKP
jgi:hypothetical protein